MPRAADRRGRPRRRPAGPRRRRRRAARARLRGSAPAADRREPAAIPPPASTGSGSADRSSAGCAIADDPDGRRVELGLGERGQRAVEARDREHGGIGHEQLPIGRGQEVRRRGARAGHARAPAGRADPPSRRRAAPRGRPHARRRGRSSSCGRNARPGEPSSSSAGGRSARRAARGDPRAVGADGS